MTNLLEPTAYEGQSDALKPYVPRLLIEWIRDEPGATYRPVEGSLAFVDISGFTALTELLARRGKVGAELLRDTLDEVFRALLDEAYGWGAGLLKWGGDALLLLYDGPGHQARAARAAWEMQRAIGRVGRLRVGATTLTLRMSVGIASGTIDFFTAGSVHRELLVVGPTATETAAIETVADAGEIRISRALAAELDPACVGAEKDGAPLLAGPPDTLRSQAPDVGAVDGNDVASCIPVASRAHNLLERKEPEHRTITAAFVDLIQTDVLLEQLGPAAFQEALHERISSIQEAALEHGVPFNLTDIAKGSVKTLLTAGAPSSTGHDEEQMLRTLRVVLDRPGIIPLRAGVNTGKVFTGDFGPPYRRAYSVFGDAINTAARVMTRAEPGQLLSTEIVLERSRTTFATTPIEPFRAKGKAEPVRALIVGAIEGRRPERAADSPFVGRSEELAALVGVLADTAAGESWIVEISGASGIGKSRFVQELLDLASELRVLRTRCEEYDASTPYFALREPLRTALGVAPGDRPAAVEERLREAAAEASLGPWVPLIGILLGLDLPPTPETQGLDERFLSETIADTATRFLGSLLSGNPTILVVEDAEYLDGATADLLARLLTADAAPAPTLMITHTDPALMRLRPDDEEARYVGLTLLPLSERQMVELVQFATDEQPLRPHEVEELARRSGGSPLFLRELLVMAQTTGSVESLPHSLEAVIAADIDRLRPADRIVLRYASVLGARFEEPVLRAALRDEVEFDAEVWERLHGLVDPDPDGGLRFNNAVIRDTAYEGLPFRRRRELHGRVAEAIESAAATPDDHAPALALHYFAAQRSREAWGYGRLAGDRARAVGANIEAGRFYELALAASRSLRAVDRRERSSVYVALGGVREASGLLEESLDALGRALQLVREDPVEQARILALRALTRVRTGAYALALRETATGLRAIDGIATPSAVAARARLHAMRGEARWLQGRPREAIALSDQAIAEGKSVGELEAVARAYTTLDGAYQLLGQPELAVHERMALEIYAKLGRTRALGITELNLGVQAYADGRWDEAIDLYTRAQDDCLRAGDRQHVAIAEANLGEVLVSRGELDEAERVLGDARRVLRSSGYTPFAVFAETQLARCALERGETERAVAALRHLAVEAAGVGYAGVALEVTLYLARAEQLDGRPELGLAALDAAALAAGDEAALYSASIERERAYCLAALGRGGEAEECLARALVAARSQGLRYEELLIRRALAHLGGGGGAAEELRETDRLAQLLGVSSG